MAHRPQDETRGTGPVLTPSGVLTALRAIGPELSERAEEAEQARRPPKDLFDKLAATGIFRMLWPAARGGGEFTLPDAIPVLETLAAFDGSAGWSTMIGVESASLWLRFPDGIATARNPQHGVLTRACLNPRGQAVETPEGWHVRGRWPLASGAYDADWFIATAIVMGADGPQMRPDGQLDLRIFAIPSDRAQMHDTWRALGLRSTMSHDVSFDTVVPADHCAQGPGVIESPYPLGRLPMWLALGPFHCAVALGIAHGALEEVIALLPSKRPMLNPTIKTSEDPLVQARIGTAATRLSGVRAFLLSEAQAIWDTASRNEEFTSTMRARSRAMMSFVHTECSAVMDDLFLLSGTTPLYDGSSLQRRYRDLRAACQHIVASPEIYRPFGALLMGVTPPMEAAL
jgi:alkylation response protein AidB-like acyl-CoA dehydrogenase